MSRHQMKPSRLAFVLIAALIVVANVGVLLAAELALTLKVVPERESGIYDVGEEAIFLINVSRGDDRVTEGSVNFVVDDFLGTGKAAGLPQGSVELSGEPAKVVAKGRRPEFLRCQVTYTRTKGKAVRASAGVGFSPEKIGMSLPVPDDFDEFWADQKRQLARVAPDPKLTAVENKVDGIESFDVQVQCLGGAPVSGYFSKPIGAESKSLPIVLWVHGAGVRSSSIGNSLKGAQHGFLSMDINAHGSPNGKPAAFYNDLSRGALNNYRHAGRESRDTIYFRGMYLRIVRAIDFLTAQPEWNGRTVVAVGHSQGGGQSLVAGGIDDRVTFIAPGVPAICDHSGNSAGRVNGWPKLVPNGADGKPDAKIQMAARYVDAVNFASRCKAEAIMSVGFIDGVCPPSSCYAAYNALLGKKSVINETLMGHAAPPHIQDAFWERIVAHAKSTK